MIEENSNILNDAGIDIYSKRFSMRTIEGTLNFPEKPKKPLKVLYIVSEYPQISQTYIHEEIASLVDDYTIEIISLKGPDLTRKTFFPYHQSIKNQDIAPFIEQYTPDVIHSHYFHNIDLLNQIAEKYSIPYTIRTHSFDVLKPDAAMLGKLCALANRKWCLGILAFPDFKDRLLGCGLDETKFVACWPVINYKKFYYPDKREFQGKVMNVGAAIGKKNYKSFIDLADQMRDKGMTFDLYAMGYEKFDLMIYNETQGIPVETIDHIEPEEMPEAYRNHDWLVYTGDLSINTIGLPLSIAEAQASGVGICMQEMPGRKQALLDFLGGAGYLFKDVSELPEIISKPYPEELHSLGLENAKKCDVYQHNSLLKELWEKSPAG